MSGRTPKNNEVNAWEFAVLNAVPRVLSEMRVSWANEGPYDPIKYPAKLTKFLGSHELDDEKHPWYKKGRVTRYASLELFVPSFKVFLKLYLTKETSGAWTLAYAEWIRTYTFPKELEHLRHLINPETGMMNL